MNQSKTDIHTNKKTSYSLILASSSPRRQAMLKMLGVDFKIQTADIDETPHPKEMPTTLVQRLSREKAQVVAIKHPDSVVIGADTIVVLGERILGKPVNTAQAHEMLDGLRGQDHYVYSAITFWQEKTQHQHTYLSKNLVTMRPYTDDEIDAYIATGDPMDKAGAYAIQHPVFAPVEKLTGCYASVVGLPLGYLVEGLQQFNISLNQVDKKCTAFTEQPCCQSNTAANESITFVPQAAKRTRL